SHSSLINIEFYPPNPLLVKIAIKIHKFYGYSLIEKKFIKAEECQQFEKILGNFIYNSYKDIEKNRIKLENLSLLDKYYNSFLSALI
ncbi:2051_t:CDS:1, partial [Racocetra fulgida]